MENKVKALGQEITITEVGDSIIFKNKDGDVIWNPSNISQAALQAALFLYGQQKHKAEEVA